MQEPSPLIANVGDDCHIRVDNKLDVGMQVFAMLQTNEERRKKRTMGALWSSHNHVPFTENEREIVGTRITLL